jgi:hypothetical protein
MHVQVAIMMTKAPKVRNWCPEAKEMQVQPIFAPELFLPSGRERVKRGVVNVTAAAAVK